MNNPLRTEVFISYSHRDDVWQGELVDMLRPYVERERRNISVWDDKAIAPGDKWEAEIHAAIRRARVAVLLVSKYFLASEYIKQKELPLIYSMLDDGLRVVWVPLSACLYTETELANLQAAFDPNHPLDARNSSEQQRALLKVCHAIREAFQAQTADNSPCEADEPDAAIAASPVLMPPTPAEQSLARDLLFCVMAVQSEWIDALQFSKVCGEWATDKSRALSDILLQRNWLSVEDKQALDAMLSRRLSRHAGDPEKALLRSGGEVVLQLVEQSKIPELKRSLDRLTQLANADGDETHWKLQTTSRYRWQSLHAVGGFSQVYTGFDQVFDRPVALKTALVSNSEDQKEIPQRRLITEAMIAGRLEHPHIVPVYDLAKREADDETFYVMRMLRGPTLADEIRRHHQGKMHARCDALERRRLVESLLCICHAMEYAHSRGVLHLDLKPQNIALGDYREVYLLDWGLSRPRPGPAGAATGEFSMTETFDIASDQTQGPIGTPGYMSPEQARGELNSFDQRTDVYGLGAILYEILTGMPPHSQEDSERDFENIRTKPVTAIRQVIDWVPPSIAAVCEKAIAFEPNDRFATVEDLSIELRRWLDDEPLLSYRVNVEHFEGLLAESPHRHDFREGIARNLIILGLIQNGMLRRAAAENSLTRAIDHYQQLVHKFPRDARLRSELAVTWLHMYYVLTDARKLEFAEVAKRNALEEYQRLTKLSPADAGHGYLESLISRMDAPGDLGTISAPMSEQSEKETYRSLEKSQRRSLAADLALLRELLENEQQGKISREELVLAVDRWRDMVEIGNPSAFHEAMASLFPKNASEETSPTEKTRQDHPELNAAAKDDTADRLKQVWSQNISATNFATLAPAAYGQEQEFGEQITGPRYRILRSHAEGGLSIVSIAYDEALHREVALKEIRSNLADRADSRARFLQEARITAALDHPGIVPIYSLGTYADSRPFYAMRLVKGQTLKDAINAWHARSERQYSPQSSEFRELLHRIIAVCNTLAYAHSHGIVHADVKPQNILIGQFGETLVIDWGLSRYIGRRIDESDDAAPASPYFGGTPAYMSPEQAAGVAELTARSDIYNLGATFYHVLVGKALGSLQTIDVANLMEARRHGKYTPPRQANSAIPKNLEAICMKALQPRPEDRYQSMLEFANAIDQWLTGDNRRSSWWRFLR